ncbi:hypothetical protein T06_2140 [Trichinella sp. T6]|nr:hypothetical protein T06_2140 [Trichinella sp. T6]
MKPVARQAVAEQFGVDVGRSTLERVFEPFEQQHAGAFADHEPVAPAVERSTRLGRPAVEAPAQSSHPTEADQAQLADRRLGTADQHQLGLATLNQRHTVDDRVQAGRAGGARTVVRTPQTVADGQLAGGHVRQHARNEIRRQPVVTLLINEAAWKQAISINGNREKK